MGWIDKHWFKLFVIVNTVIAFLFFFGLSSPRLMLISVCLIAFWVIGGVLIEAFKIGDVEYLEEVNDVSGK